VTGQDRGNVVNRQKILRLREPGFANPGITKGTIISQFIKSHDVIFYFVDVFVFGAHGSLHILFEDHAIEEKIAQINEDNCRCNDAHSGG